MTRSTKGSFKGYLREPQREECSRICATPVSSAGGVLKEIEKTLLKPNIPRTIRFTPILYDWILEVSEKEGLSFNQIVLLCCKYAKDQYVEPDAQKENE